MKCKECGQVITDLTELCPARQKESNSAFSDVLCVKLTEEEIKAIDDANDYVYNVADDRGNAYIDYDRKEAVYKILRDLLDRINT